MRAMVCSDSALPLLMAWVDTDHAHNALALDHFALVTNLLDAGSHLHEPDLAVRAS